MSESAIPNKKRYSVLSIIQIISCFIILLKHAIPDSVSDDGLLFRGFCFVMNTASIDFFALAAFMIASGLLCNMSLSRHRLSYPLFVSKRAARLLAPYFVINTLLYVPKSFLNQYMQAKTELSFMAYFEMLLTPRNGVSANLWFLPVLFVFGVLSPLLYKLYSLQGKKWRIICVVLSLVIVFIPNTTNFLCVNDIRNYFFFYCFGFMSKDELLHLLTYAKKKETIVAGVLAIAAIVLSFSIRRISMGRVVYLLCGVSLIFAVSILLDRSRLKGPLMYFDNKTFPIYILSFPVMTAVDIVFGILNVPVLVTVVCMLLSGIIIPVLICEIIRLIEVKTNHGLRIVRSIIGG